MKLEGKFIEKASLTTFLVMLVITIIGTVLRLLFIDKAEGLWNDEYVSWSIAVIPFGKSFLQAIFAQCHMPFYYLYLKFFTHFIGSSDLVLRFTSVLPGIVSIWAMYFVGREFKNRNLGILCATFTAISSFLIYFSQEVRFYSLLFLFSAVLLLFTLRLMKNQTLFNFIIYLVSAVLIISTHTIGFVYVFFNTVFVSIWLGKTNNKYKKSIIIGWSILFLIALVLSPLVFKIFIEPGYAQWWDHFSLAKLGFLMTDYFSPVLTNIVSSPDNFFYNFNLTFVVFGVFSMVIAVVGIVRALITKRYDFSGLFLVCCMFVFVLMLMSMFGKLVFLTKYSIQIYPTLIVLMGWGLAEFENKKLGKVLIFLFCFINLSYLVFNSNSAPKMKHNQGHKLVADLIDNAKLNHGDFILLNYYPKEKFEKYYDFKNYNVISINKYNFPGYIGGKGGLDAIKNGKNLYKEIFEKQKNVYFEEKINKEILNSMKQNQKITVIVLNDVSMFSPVQVHAIAENPNEYKKTPFLFLVFSELKNEELKIFLEKLSITRLEQKGSWTAVTFTKR